MEQRIIRAIESIQPSVTFIIANQNSPVPEHVFCDVSVIGRSFADTPEVSNDEFKETINQTALFRISLTYHGLVLSDASAAVSHMAAYLDGSFQARLKFKEQGLSIIRVNDIQDSPLLKDSDMYMTYTLDFTVATIQGHSFQIDVIDRVSVEGDLGNLDYKIKVDI